MTGVLPDVLRPGLQIVFCGTAAGTASARARAYYAGPGNWFGTAEFDVAALEARIATAEPTHLAFNGKNAARAVLQRSVAYGPQDERIGGASVWVPPLHIRRRPRLLEHRALA